MTADRPMTPMRVTLALVLVMVAVLLAVGCMMGGEGMKSGGNEITQNVTILEVTSRIPAALATGSVGTGPGNFPTKVTTPFPSFKTPQNNTFSWITVDPISDQYVWDSPVITGHTNLDPGSILLVQVYEQLHTCPLGLDCKFWSISGHANVTAGDRGNNT